MHQYEFRFWRDHPPPQGKRPAPTAWAVVTASSMNEAARQALADLGFEPAYFYARQRAEVTDVQTM